MLRCSRLRVVSGHRTRPQEYKFSWARIGHVILVLRYWRDTGESLMSIRKLPSVRYQARHTGPDGIHQDLSKANDYMTASALAGFRPTMNQLGDLLALAASRPPRH